MAPIIPAWNAPGLNIPAPQPLPEDVRNPIGSLAKALEGIAETQRQRRMDEAQFRQQQMQAEIHRMKMDEMRRAQRSELDVQGVLKDVFTTPPTVAPLGADTVAFDADEDERDRLQQAYQRLMSIATPEARQLAESLKTKVDMAQQRIDLQQMRAESTEKASRLNTITRLVSNSEGMSNLAKANPTLFKSFFTGMTPEEFLAATPPEKKSEMTALMKNAMAANPGLPMNEAIWKFLYELPVLRSKATQQFSADLRPPPYAQLEPALDRPGWAFNQSDQRFYLYGKPTEYTVWNPPPAGAPPAPSGAMPPVPATISTGTPDVVPPNVVVPETSLYTDLPSRLASGPMEVRTPSSEKAKTQAALSQRTANAKEASNILAAVSKNPDVERLKPINNVAIKLESEFSPADIDAQGNYAPSIQNPMLKDNVLLTQFLSAFDPKIGIIRQSEVDRFRAQYTLPTQLDFFVEKLKMGQTPDEGDIGETVRMMTPSMRKEMLQSMRDIISFAAKQIAPAYKDAINSAANEEVRLRVRSSLPQIVRNSLESAAAPAAATSGTTKIIKKTDPIPAGYEPTGRGGTARGAAVIEIRKVK